MRLTYYRSAIPSVRWLHKQAKPTLSAMVYIGHTDRVAAHVYWGCIVPHAKNWPLKVYRGTGLDSAKDMVKLDLTFFSPAPGKYRLAHWSTVLLQAFKAFSDDKRQQLEVPKKLNYNTQGRQKALLTSAVKLVLLQSIGDRLQTRLGESLEDVVKREYKANKIPLWLVHALTQGDDGICPWYYMPLGVDEVPDDYSVSAPALEPLDPIDDDDLATLRPSESIDTICDWIAGQENLLLRPNHEKVYDIINEVFAYWSWGCVSQSSSSTMPFFYSKTIF
jgi:hypothetical protein